MTAYSYSCYNSLIRRQSPCSSATSAEPSDSFAATISNPISVFSMYLPSPSRPSRPIPEDFYLSSESVSPESSLPSISSSVSSSPMVSPIFSSPIVSGSLSPLYHSTVSPMPISQTNSHESLFDDLSMVNFPPSSPSFSSSSYPAISRSLPMFPSSLPIESFPPTPLPSPEDRSAPPTYLNEFALFGEPQSFPQSLRSARHSELLAPLTTTFVKNASRGLSLSISGNLGRTLAASWIRIPT